MKARADSSNGKLRVANESCSRKANVVNILSPSCTCAYPNLLSNWVNRAQVNSNFELDVGSFTLNFSCNFEISNQNSNFEREIQFDILNSRTNF